MNVWFVSLFYVVTLFKKFGLLMRSQVDFFASQVMKVMITTMLQLPLKCYLALINISQRNKIYGPVSILRRLYI